MEIARYRGADEYVSTRCWLGEHRECQQHPIVRCACLCHEVEALGIDGDRPSSGEPGPDGT